MAAINQAIKEGKAAQTERVLRNPAVALRGVVPACAAGYQRVLEGAMAEKRRPGNAPPDPRLRLPGHLRPPEPPPLTGACAGDTALWVQHDTQDGTAYYLHLQTLQGTWERPPGGRLNTSHLAREEIQVGGAPAGGRGWGSRGRGSHPRGTTALCRLHSPPSARSPLPMTASSSGRPARASSSGSRPGSEASWLGRGSPRAPAS